MVNVLAHFVDSVPQPLTDALVNLAPLLAVAARSTRLVDWSDDWYSSWLTLASWWLLCLAAPALFRYALPITAATVVILATRQQPALLVTESVLEGAIADLTALRSALPTIPPVSLPPIALLRAAAVLTIPWVILAHLIRGRILIAIFGTLVLTHRAPWARVLRSVLWRSAFVRTSLYRFQAFLTGQPLPEYVVSNQPTPTTPAPVPSLRFLFTIYENQRWWVGLDWTAALLPAERPSWCSPALHPISPPSAFTLPDPTTVYLPSPDGKSRIKRTAVWKWEEPEWRLLVRKEGSPLSRIERAPPTIDDPSVLSPSSSTTSSGSRLFKAAANKFKESSIASPPTSPPANSDTIPSEAANSDDSEEPFTDPDGWIFGDNKWENQSHRGGLGKYTRSRRWTRVAIVSEIVDVVEQGELGVLSPQKQPKTQSPERSTSSSSSSAVAPPDPESPLRQRLRAALSKSSISS
ncbi:hypothetical protein P691DRAFT_724417 [Macrolepiota fuliginosa MF-IS2]|uniref:Peroxin/Ferlin domain-containing protein n=1 Tax=Macrolepiota fuliginosa MF-IS2 TaxID=1400762 RepID=A0A9P5XK89_9AGAR|nr:hypothetical protein P691DRAFT_724417 [Macrolepiota fuliginosa MF-IS2]